VCPANTPATIEIEGQRVREREREREGNQRIVPGVFVISLMSSLLSAGPSSQLPANGQQESTISSFMLPGEERERIDLKNGQYLTIETLESCCQNKNAEAVIETESSCRFSSLSLSLSPFFVGFPGRPEERIARECCREIGRY